MSTLIAGIAQKDEKLVFATVQRKSRWMGTRRNVTKVRVRHGNYNLTQSDEPVNLIGYVGCVCAM